jgi:hypothetical protein
LQLRALLVFTIEVAGMLNNAGALVPALVLVNNRTNRDAFVWMRTIPGSNFP